MITSIDDTPVRHAHDLPRLIARRAPGTRVTLKVLGRDRAARTVSATLDELGKDDSAGEERPARGTTPPPGGRGDFGLELGDDGRGDVFVEGVDRGSLAADALEPGDIILEVNGAPVTDATGAAARVRSTSKDRPLLLKVRRNGRSLFVAVDRK